MSDERVKHKFEFNAEFEYIRIVMGIVGERAPIGEVILTYSFLNECQKESGNEQWVPLSYSNEKYLVAKDFNAHKAVVPWIRLKFDVLDSNTGSPFREGTSTKNRSQHKSYTRSSYNYKAVSSNSPIKQEDYNIEQKSISPTQRFKTASLRRKEHMENPTHQSEYRGKS